MIQIYNPLSNIWLSAFVASLPIFVFLTSLLVLKLKGIFAAFLTVLVSSIIALTVYKMPFIMVLMSFVQGFLTALWPIGWIIIAAIFLYKLSIKSGYFEILKKSIVAITPDYRIQVVLITYCFGSFLEGAIGFGGPVAITTALIVGIGIKPVSAAGLALIANIASGGFGAVGITITSLAASSGIDSGILAAMTSRMIPPTTILIPFLLVFIMDGFNGIKDTFLVTSVIGITYFLGQFFASNFLGAELPSIISAFVSIICTTLFLKIYKIKNIKTIDKEETKEEIKLNFKDVFKAWMPFLLLILFIIIWLSPYFKNFFNFTTIKFSLPFIHNNIIQVTPIVLKDTPIPTIYSWDIITTTGTAIFTAAIISVFMLKIKTKIAIKTFTETLKETFIPVITIAFIVAYAMIAKNSAQAATIGLSLAQTGNAFTFFSPVIGWLGVFLTGSVTSSNLLFGTLQQVTATQLGITDVVFLGANTVGGTIGKSISPQSVAVACAAVGIVGKESEVFKYTLKISIALIILVSIISWLTVNVFSFIIPPLVGN